MSFDTAEKPNWCSGCGNFSILTAIKKALQELELKPHNVVLTSGIGCSSKIPHWVKTYGFNGLHGRPVPLAEGVKLANHELKVLAFGGDGDGYAEGTNHFVHFCRRNMNVTYVVHDNQIYGLTKGQASPTSDEDFVTKTSPWGVIEKPVNPLALAIVSGATFVARGFAGDPEQLKELMKKAIKHEGSALLDVLQPCVTFNTKNTYDWYRQRVYYLSKPAETRPEAVKKALEWGKRIPLGVFYQSKEETYESKLAQLKTPLVKQKLKTCVKKLVEELK